MFSCATRFCVVFNYVLQGSVLCLAGSVLCLTMCCKVLCCVWLYVTRFCVVFSCVL